MDHSNVAGIKIIYTETPATISVISSKNISKTFC